MLPYTQLELYYPSWMEMETDTYALSFQKHSPQLKGTMKSMIKNYWLLRFLIFFTDYIFLYHVTQSRVQLCSPFLFITVH